MKRIAVIILATSFLFLGCEEDECEASVDYTRVDAEQLAIDIDIIDSYLQDNGIVAVEHESGLRYVIHTEGNGSPAGICDNVLASYVGYRLARTSPFDYNTESPIPLRNVITGWQIAFTELGAGTSATLYIPSVLAYGTYGKGPLIPENANLVFEIDFIAIQ